MLPDGTALGDIRYTLQTDGDEVLDVEPSEYTFRTATQIETAAPVLDWLNKGVFVSVGGRTPGGVIYETYLVA